MNLLRLQEARYVIESVIGDPNFEGLVLVYIAADFRNEILVGEALDEIHYLHPFARLQKHLSAENGETTNANICKLLPNLLFQPAKRRTKEATISVQLKQKYRISTAGSTW